jgi:transcriptional regulator with XRE-family HTH domain
MVDQRDLAPGTGPQNLNELLRELVRDGMAKRRWSQARLSEATNVSQKHLSQLLNGKTVGSVDVWDRLLKAVGDDEEKGDDDQ